MCSFHVGAYLDAAREKSVSHVSHRVADVIGMRKITHVMYTECTRRYAFQRSGSEDTLGLQGYAWGKYTRRLHIDRRLTRLHLVKRERNLHTKE